MAAAFFNLDIGGGIRSAPAPSPSGGRPTTPPAPGGDKTPKRKGDARQASAHSAELAAALKEQRKHGKALRKECQKTGVTRLPDNHPMAQTAATLLAKVNGLRKAESEDSAQGSRKKQRTQPGENNPNPTTSAAAGGTLPADLHRLNIDAVDANATAEAMDADGGKVAKRQTYTYVGADCARKVAQIRDSLPDDRRTDFCKVYKLPNGEERVLCGYNQNARFNPATGAISIRNTEGKREWFNHELFHAIPKDERESKGLPRKWKEWVFNPENPFWLQA